MNKGLYSIYDKVAKEYAGPFLDNNDAAASRRFMVWSRHNASQITVDDFSLHLVGEFDVSTGEIIPCFKDVAVNEGEND